MPNHAKTPLFLPSCLVATALMVLLYFFGPTVRSLSLIRLAGCFLGLLAIEVTYQWAYRSRRDRSREDDVSDVLRWYGKGETVQVGPYTLHDPLIYMSDGSRFVDEVSCIDPELPIGKPIKEPPGSLGFFPEYSRLTPAQRAHYLKWLAGGRSGPLSEAGYARLFFYGLERRLLLEGKDLDPIIREVVRLLETYTFSGPFDGVLRRFLAYSLARGGIDKVQERWFAAVFERMCLQNDEQYLAMGLAWLLSHQRPLPTPWAVLIAGLDPQTSRSIVLERLPEQFGALFARRYREQYGEGMLLRAARRDREVTYRPASPSLSDDFAATTRCPPVRIPDVLGNPGQFAPLVSIWASCIEELKPLSRVLARGAEVRTPAAYEALPDKLKADPEHPARPAWDRLVAEKAGEDGMALVEIGALAHLQGIASRPKLTARQSEALARTADAVGFVIEPDPRVTHRPYGWGDLVALVRPEGTPSLPADARYPAAALMLELGMFVAAADGPIEDEEVGRIARFLEAQLVLDPPDARRLEALKRVFLRRHPTTIGGIGKRLKATLDAKQIESLGAFLVGVAGANGAVSKKEITALRSAYKALGIDAQRLEPLLEESRRREKEPVEVLPASESPDDGEAIPPHPASGPRPVIRLDAAVLERLMHETRQVASLLDGAMAQEGPGEDEDEDEDGDEADEPRPEPLDPAHDARFEGLDGRYRALLAELSARPSWPRADFEALVRRHSLMPSGTLDVINGWAYERFDDPILEDGGEDLIVHADLLLERA